VKPVVQPTKTCSRCDIPRPISEFLVRGNGRSGSPRYLSSPCRSCATVAMRDWYRRNPARGRAKATRWRKMNPELVWAIKSRNRAKIRSEVVLAYGGKCVCCEETEPIFLTIDHVDSRANGDRMRSEQLYRSLKARCWPKDNYRLLCMNCNAGRYRNGGICPHEL